MSGLCCDSSAIISFLVDSGPDGSWVADTLAHSTLHAPALLPFECGNILRRHEAAGLIGTDQADQAYRDLADLPVELWPYDALAARIWELRRNLTSYDAAYVALAEAIGVPLVTLDRRLARASGAACVMRTPDSVD
ncbi:MAG: type II toxin-antitoxin system VapC family toxin [Mycobacterium sp.]|nr:type II toxin-antitoxin system VapC family toxin [Mycobacterium sp.]